MLVVDDDPVVRRLVQGGLAPLGCDVLDAPDGAVAQAILTARDVDLVVTDVLMPELDGPGLMRWAREHRPGPVWIVLSGLDTFEAAVEALHAGAFDFLAKPPRVAELQVAARNALERRRLERDKARLDAELRAGHERLEQKVAELEAACRLLEEQGETIRSDLRRAALIQHALLPHATDAPGLSGDYSVHAIYRPGRQVGGDLYDVRCADRRHVVLYVADAAGHGVSAAMLSVMYKQRLKTLGADGAPLAPQVALEAVNHALRDDFAAPGLFLTAVYGVLDTGTGVLRVASAGHPPALVRRACGAVVRLPHTGPALGLTRAARYTERTVRLARGDRLLMYSDGVFGIEADHAASEARLCAALARESSGAEVVGEILAAVRSTGVAGAADDRDDVTLVLLDARAGTSTFDNRASAPDPRVAVREAARLSYGESAERTFLHVGGRATWTLCDLFEAACRACREARRPVTIDLAECSYLDSTFLGTIHEAVVLASDPRAGVDLQNVDPALREMFEELRMTQVLSAIRADPIAAPDDPVDLAERAIATGGSSRRVLRAHEQLAALCASNQAKFAGLVEALRREMRGG